MPMYPDFQPIRLEVKPALQNYVRRFPPYSDFSVWNLLGWDTVGKTSYSFLNNNLIIRSRDYDDGTSVYSILGKSRIDLTLQELCTITPCIEFVPEIVIENMTEPHLFCVVVDPDNHDYILSLDKLVNPCGNKLYSIRVDINRFPRMYPEHTVKVLDLCDQHVRAEVLEMTRMWCESREFDEESSEDEEEITNRLMYFAPYFQSLSLGLYVGEELIGITMNELFDANTAIMHIGRCDLTYEGSSRYLMHMTGRSLQERGFHSLNYGQDAGVPGLRCAKRAYQPVDMLRKFKVRAQRILEPPASQIPGRLQLV